MRWCRRPDRTEAAKRNDRVTEICDSHSEGFSQFVTSLAAPLAAGALAERDSNPLESATFARRTPFADISVA